MKSGRAASLALQSVALAALAGGLLDGVAAAAPELGPECAPFQAAAVSDDASGGPVQRLSGEAPIREPGLATTAGPGASSSDPGLPSAAPPESTDAASEVLLVLPKGSDGAVPSDFELAPGARVASSFWSPVLCASVARVLGPPGTAPQALLARLPETAQLAVNEVYRTAGAEVSREAPPAEGGEGAGKGDPYRPLQYALDRLGVDASRTVTDGRGAVVAVLDSAPATPLRDLPTVEVVESEDPGVWPPGLHGTLVAGVIGAAAHNGFGIEGVAPGASLLAIPVCTPQGGARDRCSLFELLRGLDTAWGHKAQIVNLSLVGPSSALLERATARLDDLGVVVVAAAGNEGSDAPRYPAAYPSVVGVAAVDRTGRIWSRSNRGASAEIAAPGVGVLSTAPRDRFTFGDGTSLAAAQVSGLLALLTAAGGDPVAARREMFREGHGARTGLDPATAGVAPVCRILARLGHPCRGAGPPEPSGPG